MGCLDLPRTVNALDECFQSSRDLVQHAGILRSLPMSTNIEDEPSGEMSLLVNSLDPFHQEIVYVYVSNLRPTTAARTKTLSDFRRISCSHKNLLSIVFYIFVLTKRKAMRKCPSSKIALVNSIYLFTVLHPYKNILL